MGVVLTGGRSSQAKQYTARYRWLIVGYILFVGLIIARLWQLQILGHDNYAARAEGQQAVSQDLMPSRGQVYATERDEAGGPRKVPLVVNRDVFLVYADTRAITDVKRTVATLADLLKLKPEKLTPLLSRVRDPYVVIQHRVSPELVERLQARKLSGINFVSEIERFYPNNNIASHLTGFVQYRDTGMVGQYGVEGYFNKTLAGRSGRLTADRNASGVLIAAGDQEITPSQNGADIVLTIDWTIQFKACSALDNWVQKHGASGGSLIVMDPRTGAIVALCGAPDFNPNIFNEVDSIHSFNNPAIFNQYEPGSVFKAITMAAAIDAQAVSPATTYTDTGSVKIGSDTIRNSDLKAHGVQSMTQVLEQSLNTGAIYAMRQLGAEQFKKYVTAFGFGQLTGIELTGEARGDVGALNQKREIYSATASFGQGISVTPLQMLVAFNALANGGRLWRPYIVREIDHADGRVERRQPTVVRRVISEKTAALISGMLVSVVENGHGQKAGVPGYYMAGKTGTAQIPKKDGQGYEAGATIGTFVGFGPVRDPKFSMIVRVDRPQDVQFAESSAAPLFGELARFMLQYYEVPPERVVSN